MSSQKRKKNGGTLQEEGSILEYDVCGKMVLVIHFYMNEGVLFS